MSMIQREVAQLVAEQLMQSEFAIDGSVSNMGRLMAAVSDARVSAHLQPKLGQGALDHVAEAANLMIRARAEMLKARRHLVESGQLAGVDTVGFGCPGAPASGQLVSHLKVVASS